MGDIQLPNNWNARPYQRPLFNYMLNKNPGDEFPMQGKRANLVWHRRSGKDSTSLNLEAVASQLRVGTYWHMLPELNQGRKVIWNGIDKYGRRMIDQAFPKEMRASVNESDMRINFKNGSIWQVVGSDNYDSLVGTNPIGIVFSEYSVADPRAWDYIRPILAENGGWAIFIYTSRGRNHGFDLYEMAKGNPNWFCELLTVDDTKNDDGSYIITPEMVQEERNSGMDEDMIMQEYYCSFDSGLHGAYFTKQMTAARDEGRIGKYPWVPNYPVHTFWDLGLRDACAIWFGQKIDGMYRFIDYEENNNIPIYEWIKILEDKPYTYGRHRGPHDLETRDMFYGEKRIDAAGNHGFFFEKTPKVSPRERIDSIQRFLPQCQFDETNCAHGIDALFNFRREYNDRLKIFMDRPLHDWASHGADAFGIPAADWPSDLDSLSSLQHKVILTSGRRRINGR